MTALDQRSDRPVRWIDATWATAGPFFEREPGDATLRDVYTPPMNLADWDSFLRAMPGPWRVEFRVDSEPRDALPTSIAAIDTILETAAPSLFIDVGGPIAICHFFSHGDTSRDTELVDFSIREITGEQQMERVFEFLRWVGDVLGRSVWMTFEAHDAPVIRFDPGTGRVLVRQPMWDVG